MSRVDAGHDAQPVIDAQVHVYQADHPARPWASHPDWPAHVTGDEMVAALDAAGVDGAIIVSPFAMYRYDASYATEVQAAHPQRFALVKPLDVDDPAIEEVIAQWKQTPGAVGVRLLMGSDAPRDPADAGVARIARAASRHGLPVNLHCWGTLESAMQVVDRYAQTTFVIDHLGMVQPFAPPVPATSWRELPQVLDMARRPNVFLKVTGACTLAREPFPFADIWPPLARIFEAWGIERCLWGTDWTRATALVGLQPAIDCVRAAGRLSRHEEGLLLGGNCARVYGWRPRGP